MAPQQSTKTAKDLTSSQKRLLEDLSGTTDEMVRLTREVADINSGSYNRLGLIHVHDFFDNLFSDITEVQSHIELDEIHEVDDSGQSTTLPSRYASVYQARTDAPLQILCTGHSDTVFQVDSEFQTTWIQDNRLRGPGVADMKGGLILLYQALKTLGHSPFAHDFGFTVLLSPDEEIGSPASAPWLEKYAKKADFGLVYEPALADGTLAGARKGSGNFSIVVQGKSVHAGREFFQGKNAIVAAAEIALSLSKISDEKEGISVNVGKMLGGGPVNIVPHHAVLHFNARTNDTDQQQRVLKEIQTAIDSVRQRSGCEIVLHGCFNRPPKPMNQAQQSFFKLLASTGQQLNLDIRWQSTGGCCEGNNLAAAGLANIDTLGVRGGAIHSDNEFAYLDSFVERAQLSALLITRLSEESKQNTVDQSD